MLIMTKDKSSIVNIDNMTYIKLTNEASGTIIYNNIKIYFTNNDKILVGSYKTANEAKSKMDDFYKAFHMNCKIYEF